MEEIIMDCWEHTCCECIKEHGIYKKKYSGTLKTSDLIFNKSSVRNVKLPKNLTAILDFTDASFIDIKPKVLDEIVEGNLEIIKHFYSLKLAFLHTKPYENAFTTLFIHRFTNFKSFTGKIFISEKSALDWLNYFNKCSKITCKFNY